MNSTQRNYAKKRIEQIVKDKINNINNRLYSYEREYSLKCQEMRDKKIKLVRDGKVKLKEKVTLNDSLERAFDFSKIKFAEPIYISYDRTNDIKEKDQIMKKSLELIDEIMIGSEYEALNAIKKMENFMK